MASKRRTGEKLRDRVSQRADAVQKVHTAAVARPPEGCG